MHPSRPILLMLILALGLTLAPLSTASAAPGSQTKDLTGGVNILSTQPMLICVGDTISFEGAAGVDLPEMPAPKPGELPQLVPLAVINLDIKAQNGKITPNKQWYPTDFTYFTFTYTATKAGTDTLTVTLNDGIATYSEPIRVQEKCDYDVYLMTVMHLRSDLGDEEFRSITTINGTGMMKRERKEGSPTLQGDGKWHLEENVLTKPAMCVQWYMPPLISSGPFKLDGKIDVEAEILNVILSFLPPAGPVYHGVSYCVDAEGGHGEGWSMSMGGDPSKASKINTSVPLGGGSNQVELEGEGMQMIQSQADVDYIATLTIIPR